MSTENNQTSKMTRRTFLQGASIAVGSVLLAACVPAAAPGGAQATKETVTIKFGSWADIFGDVLKGFNETHPDTQVEMAISPWQGYAEKMLTQFAGGTAPDVMWVQAPFYPMLVRRAVFAALDAQIERDKPDLDGLVVHPKVWASFEGKIYGIPAHGAVPRGLAYNRRLFNEAGVELPRYADWTMDEMDAAAKKIAQPPEIWGAIDPPNMVYLDLIISNGGALFNEDETQCLLNSPEARAAFNYVVDWRLQAKIAPTPGERELMGENIFASDKIAMMAAVLSDWDSFGPITKDHTMDATMALWPIMPGGKRVSTGQAHPFCMPSNSANLEQAWEFVKYYVWDPAAIRAMIKLIPVSYKFAEYAAENIKDETQLQFMTEPFNYADTFIPEYWGTKPTEVQKAFQEELDLMLLGDKSVDEATDAMVEKINAIQAEA